MRYTDTLDAFLASDDFRNAVWTTSGSEGYLFVAIGPTDWSLLEGADTYSLVTPGTMATCSLPEPPDDALVLEVPYTASNPGWFYGEGRTAQE